jgi:ATP-binding cassette subfamily F protein 3
VLLDALEDYGGTLIFVSHDRYFVEKLATKIIEIGHGEAIVYPGTYAEYLWHKEHPQETPKSQSPKPKSAGPKPKAQSPKPEPSRDTRKLLDAERRKKQRENEALRRRIADLESRIADRETQVKEIEAAMSAARFYEDRDAAAAMVTRHQALMWEVGDLMSQWEALQEHASEHASES